MPIRRFHERTLPDTRRPRENQVKRFISSHTPPGRHMRGAGERSPSTVLRIGPARTPHRVGDSRR